LLKKLLSNDFTAADTSVVNKGLPSLNASADSVVPTEKQT